LPLFQYFKLGGNEPKFKSTCTALWRGYVGSWEIIDKRLYLVKLKGALKDGTVASLETVFPGFPERVFAHWYCGTIRIPEGKILEYKHMGFGSTYEKDLLIEIEQGVVKEVNIKQNGVSDNLNGAEGYGVAAFTTFAKKEAIDKK